MSTIQRSLILVCCLLIFPVNCQAEEDNSGWRFGVIPRLWISAITGADEDNVSQGTIFVPLIGGTVSVSPGFAPNISLLATGFYGKGEGEGVFLEPESVDPFTSESEIDGTTDTTRTDVEILLRYTFPGTGFSINAGGRYVKFDGKFETDSGPIVFSNKSEDKFLFGELGMGFSSDITDDGRHRMFGNLIGLFGKGKGEFKDSQGFRSSDSGFGVGGDMNIGYQWRMASFATASLRYRVFLIPTENDFDLLKFASIQGPELSIGLLF